MTGYSPANELPRAPGEPMTADEFRARRIRLGLTQYELADALNLGGSTEKGAQRVREMEAGARPITGPIERLMEAFADGWRPES